jgi:molecular chaperone DnaJ
VRRTMLGQFVQTAVCVRCGGSGQVIGSPCEDCRGTGRTFMERSVNVQIPAGIDSGQRIRVSGRGGAGERRNRAGDLYVRVRVAEHELFERRGDDILYEVGLTMIQAALGTNLTVPTLDGDEEVTFAAGTQPGEVKTLRGKGVPHLSGHGRGDQEILVRVFVPHGLDQQQQRLLQEFEESCGGDHYGEHDDGVLHRLRNWLSG